MTNPTDIGAVRMAKAKHSGEATPRDLLIELVRRIDAGEISPEHLTVIAKSNGSHLTIMNAGNAKPLEVFGMLHRASLDFHSRTGRPI